MAAVGVELEQVAAVHADLEAGFPLAEVLAVENIDAARWPYLEAAWKVSLVDEPEVFARYEAARAEHRRRLARPVKPLDEDVDAWVVFLRCYEEADDPFALLAGLRMSLGDMALLGEHWGRRFDASTKLAQRAAKVSLRLESRFERHGERAPVPFIEVGEPRLVASPAAVRAARQAERKERIEVAEKKAVPLTLDAYAALVAALEVARPDARGEVLARLGIDAAQAEALDEVWQARMEEDRLLRSDFNVLRRHYTVAAKLRKRSAAEAGAAGVASVGAWVPPTPPTAALASSRTAAGVDQTATGMPALVLEEVLPFVDGPGEAPAPVELPPRAASDVDGTGMIDADLLAADVMPFASFGDGTDVDGTAELSPELLAADVMPFTAAADDAPPPRLVSLLAGEVTAGDDGERGDDLDGTSALLPAFVPDEALPFEREEATSPASASIDDRFDASLDDASSTVDADAGALEDVAPSLPAGSVPVGVDTTGTFASIDWSEEDVVAASRPAGDRGEPSPPRGGDEDLDATSAFTALDRSGAPWATADDGDLDATSAFMSIDWSDQEEQRVPPQVAPSPAVAPPAPTVARLTLQQYASLHLELRRWPALRSQVLSRYGLEEGSLQDEDAYWRARWTPEVAAEFHRAQEAYGAWLAQQGR